MFPNGLLPSHKGAKQNIIGVTRGTNVNHPHHWGLVLTYPVENAMPLVHHVKEQ